MASGERRIDAAELERVFPAAVARAPQSHLTHIATLTAQLTSSQEKTALLERTNEDLRQRLDASEAERRNVQTQLNALLSATPVTPINQPRPLGRRILAWLAREHGWLSKAGTRGGEGGSGNGRCRALMLSA